MEFKVILFMGHFLSKNIKPAVAASVRLHRDTKWEWSGKKWALLPGYVFGKAVKSILSETPLILSKIPKLNETGCHQ